MRDPRHIAITIVFLLMVFGVPVSQAILDVRDDMAPQALEVFDLPDADDSEPWYKQLGAKILSAMDGDRLREYEEALEGNSVFETAGRERFQFVSLMAIGALGEKAIRGRDGWFFYSPGVKYLAEPYFRHPHSAAFGKDDPVEVIADFAAQLRARGIDLLVVPVPGKASIYPDRLTSSLEPNPAVYANTSSLRAELDELGVETVDLHAAIAAVRAREPERQLYMKADTHWTGEGVLVAASALAERIRAGGWAPEAGDRYRRKPVLVLRRGDVIEMTKIPGRQEWFDDETVTAYQIVDRETGETYEDDDDSPILVLGDSFSRVFQTDEPGSAGVIANLAFELQAPLASIVNDGGASTLVREQLARRPQLLEGKKLVIWEFIERDVRFGMRGWKELQIVLDE